MAKKKKFTVYETDLKPTRGLRHHNVADVYVGSTGKPLKDREKDHREGRKSGIVRAGYDSNITLRPVASFDTRDEALAYEEKHADRLEKRGVAVWQK